MIPDGRVVAFGHVGDGNVHFNISQPVGMDAQEFIGMRDRIAATVYAVTSTFGGSISAEHGIGVLKREQLQKFRGDTEMSIMRAVKKSLDPNTLLNPGKVL